MKPLPRELQALAASLQDLPVLATLMPSPWELMKVMEEIDTEAVMERLAVLLHEEVGGEEGCSEIVREEFTNRCDAAASTANLEKKKKRKKAKTKRKKSEVIDKGDQSNMFQALA